MWLHCNKSVSIIYIPSEMLLRFIIAFGLCASIGECSQKHGYVVDRVFAIKQNLYFIQIHNNWIFYCNSSKICLTTKNQFIESIVLYKRCALQHSVPATICRDCFGDFVSVLKTFDKFANATDPNLNKKSCAAEYTDQNRLNIIPKELDAIKQLWTDGYCSSE